MSLDFDVWCDIFFLLFFLNLSELNIIHEIHSAHQNSLIVPTQYIHSHIVCNALPTFVICSHSICTASICTKMLKSKWDVSWIYNIQFMKCLVLWQAFDFWTIIIGISGANTVPHTLTFDKSLSNSVHVVVFAIRLFGCYSYSLCIHVF